MTGRLAASTTLADDEIANILTFVLHVRCQVPKTARRRHQSQLSIILLDAEGREIGRSEKLGVPDSRFVQQVKLALEERW